MTSDPDTYDMIIVGAGVLGSVMAVAFSKPPQNRRILLIERDWSEPDRIVGELLQPAGVKALEELGLGWTFQGIDAVREVGYEVIYHGERQTIPYPYVDIAGKIVKEYREVSSEEQKARAIRKAAGVSFHHGRFVMNLRKAAKACDSVTPLAATVTDILHDKVANTVSGVKCSDGKEYKAALTVVCDGIFSKYRKQFLKVQPRVESYFVAMELLDAELPNPNHGHVILSDHAPVLVYQIGARETRILCAVRSSTIPSNSNGKLEKYFLNELLPELPKEIQPSFRAAVARKSFRSMPNSFLPATCNSTPGLLVVGDALNMRHPLTGGGMTVAFNDVLCLRELLSVTEVPDLSDTEMVLTQLQSFHWERKKLASVINILAMALYALFAADGYYLKILQRGCFRYFQRGGESVLGPVSLLSGLAADPLLLIYHFFYVALYAIYCHFLDLGIWGFPKGVFDTVMTLYTACVVIFPYIWAEIRHK